MEQCVAFTARTIICHVDGISTYAEKVAMLKNSETVTALVDFDWTIGAHILKLD